MYLFVFLKVDKEEVRLRRTIGLKKDEYFLDGKHITLEPFPLSHFPLPVDFWRFVSVSVYDLSNNGF